MRGGLDPRRQARTLPSGRGGRAGHPAGSSRNQRRGGLCPFAYRHGHGRVGPRHMERRPLRPWPGQPGRAYADRPLWGDCGPPRPANAGLRPCCSRLLHSLPQRPCRFDGPYYQIGRPAFQPGGEEGVSDPPIYLAAVNPFMTGVAGEVGDGLAAHPFSTPEYLRDVLRPALAAGASNAGRPTPKVLLQLVVARTRAAAATQMHAYSVPAYRRVLDHAGLGELADRVMAASREEARTLIERGYLDRLGVIIGDDLAAGIGRWRGLADRITLSVPWFGTNDGDQLHQTERLIQRIGSLT